MKPPPLSLSLNCLKALLRYLCFYTSLYEWYSNLIFAVIAIIKLKKNKFVNSLNFRPFFWMKVCLNFKNLKVDCIHINLTMYRCDFLYQKFFSLSFATLQKKQLLLFKFLKPIMLFQSWIFVDYIASNRNVIGLYNRVYMDERK